jgi:hypothetical protein
MCTRLFYTIAIKIWTEIIYHGMQTYRLNDELIVFNQFAVGIVDDILLSNHI